MFLETPATTIRARFEFQPDRAAEFIEQPEDGIQTICELEFDEPEELITYCEDFREALIDVNAIINGQDINLSDFPF